MNGARLSVTEERGRLHVQWFCRDAATWYRILRSFKETFNRHWQCTYCSSMRSWSMPLAARSVLTAWANAHFDPDAQVWDEPEPATRRNGTPPATVEEAYRVLHLLPSAPQELVAAAHRILQKQVHPDRGGTHEAAVQVNKAIGIIRAAHKGGRRSA